MTRTRFALAAALLALGLASGALQAQEQGRVLVTILDETGKEWGLAGRSAVSLCRCGQSAKKPFCDGSHNRVGFSSTCEAAELPPPAPKA